MKGILLQKEIEENVPLTIATDPERLSQIIINLTSNALKFTKVGFVKLEATISESNMLNISVRDTGVGINLD